MTSQGSDAPHWDASGFQQQVQDVLTGFVEDRRQEAAPLGEDAGDLVDAAHTATRGGKRLRAMFCYWGFHAVRPPADESEARALLRAASALELLHASALVHDDLMDASDTRRGRPATHRAFACRHREQRWPGDSERYGAAAAILLGDLLLAWSDGLLRECGMPAEEVGQALRYFDTTRTEVVLGQFLDVSTQARGDHDVQHAMQVLRYKSAKYSVERPLHLGAALAGGSTDQLSSLTDYGLPLGEAFQLRDDLLGVFGDPEVTGKPAGDDLVEGKRTVLVGLALEGLAEPEAAELRSGLGRPLDGREVVAMQRAIERSGAHAEVERRIEDLTRQSMAALASAPLDDAARGQLRALAVAATRRVV